jgi:regulator of nucleoside diphosphate kinase
MTMKVSGKPPPITITRDVHDQLWNLALAALDRDPTAEILLDELSRARLVRSGEAGSAGLGMHQAVDFQLDDELHRQCRLVYPLNADFAKGSISVLTPVGVMLIGLTEGQSMSWTGGDGRDHTLKVIRRHDSQEHDSQESAP